MRVLFTFAGGSGHLDPLLPVARAADSAGHIVAFAGRPWMVPIVEALGFSGFASGSDVGLTPRRLPLRKLDVKREERAFRDGFAGRIARERAPDILDLCAAWRPDLLVWEETDFGAAVAAECLSLAHASVLVSATGSFVRKGPLRRPLNQLRAELGLPADPELTMLNRHLVLSPFPPSLRDPEFPLPVTAHGVRPSPLEPMGTAVTPGWMAGFADAPTVYVTLGTVFNMESSDLFARLLLGLRDLAVNVIATVGRDFDPRELGPQPANVHIERYVPQSVLLPYCSLVVSHGGSGSVVGALAHGLPMVLLPMGADQPHNAARCRTLGVARVLDAMTATPELVREAVSAVLADPAYRLSAERVKAEIAALPGPDHAVTLLEQLRP